MTAESRKLSSSHTAEKAESARVALLCAARKLFAEMGFDGVSVKEVAQATGHNPALINYYFNGKEGLYRSCVEPLIGQGMLNLQHLLQPPTSRQDFITRFTLFVQDLVDTSQQNSELCLLLKRDSNTEVVRNLYKEHFARKFKTCGSFLKAAKKLKILRPGLDVAVATHIVFGAVFDLILMDPFRFDAGENCFLDHKHRAATIRQLTDFMLAGMLAEPLADS